eukprot:m.22498 g.22498  ORF g.22498 m.22498 type:complete len:55 (-) comp33967_c0_seq1:214-378(-)
MRPALTLKLTPAERAEFEEILKALDENAKIVGGWAAKYSPPTLPPSKDYKLKVD